MCKRFRIVYIFIPCLINDSVFFLEHSSHLNLGVWGVMSRPETNRLMQPTPLCEKSGGKQRGTRTPDTAAFVADCRISLCIPWSLWSPLLWSYSDDGAPTHSSELPRSSPWEHCHSNFPCRSSKPSFQIAPGTLDNRRNNSDFLYQNDGGVLCLPIHGRCTAQRPVHQLFCHTIGHRISCYLLAKQVLMGCQIQPTFLGGNVGDIAEPYLIGSRRFKLLIQQVTRWIFSFSDIQFPPLL